MRKNDGGLVYHFVNLYLKVPFDLNALYTLLDTFINMSR